MPPLPEPGTGSIEIRHVLERAVPASIDSFRFTGFDANGQVVYGPDTRAKAADILLTGVPTTTRTLQIEYLSNGVVVGIFRVEVVVAPGQTVVIEDPDWRDVVPDATATQLSFLAIPAAGAPGQVLSPAVQVAVLDANGAQVTGSTAPVTLSGPNLQGTLTVNAVDGVATFSDLVFASAGTFQLSATSPDLAPATSGPIVISAAPIAAGLQFTQEPPDADSQIPSVQVQVVDQFGQPFPGFTGDVSLALGSNPTGASLQGILTQPLVNGVATFQNLFVTSPGTYTLIASSAGLTPATSRAFQIRIGQFQRRAFSIVTPLGIGGGFSVAHGDFDGDGLEDAAVGSTGEISLLRQTPEGDFTTTFLPALGMRGVQVGDVNGDGRPDLVSLIEDAGSFSAEVRVNQDGSFAAPVSTSLGAGVLTVPDFTVADVNGDGLSDALFALTDGGGAAVSTLLSTGTALGAPLRTDLLGATPVEVVVGPLVAGSEPDFAVSVDAQVEIYSGAGDGTFSFNQALPPLTGTYRPAALALADFDLNAELDIAVFAVDSQVPQIVVYLNAGGTFTPSSPFPQGNGLLVPPNTLATGDFNQDGGPDLVLVNNLVGTADVLLSDATPGNPILTPGGITPIGLSPVAVVAADFNNDGLLDVGSALANDRFVRLNGDGQGNLLPRPGLAEGQISLDVGDVNGDGRLDLVTAGEENGIPPVHFHVFVRQADNTLPTTPTFDISVAETITLITLADFEQDGDLDLMAMSPSGSLNGYLNPGTGNFSANADISVPLPGDAGLSLAAGDVNGDGLPDFISSSNTPGSFDVALAAAPPLSYNAVTQPTTGTVADVFAVDLDGDGRAEILTAEGSSGIGLYRWQVGNTFSSSLFDLGGERVNTVGAGDLNQDGSPDVVGATSQGATALGFTSVLLNDGNGTLAAPQTLPGPGFANPIQVLVADANGDGFADILISDQDAYGAAVYTGRGDGLSFLTGSLISSGGALNSRRSLVVTDLNGDARPEPVFAAAGGTWISVLTLLGLVSLRLALARRRRAV